MAELGDVLLHVFDVALFFFVVLFLVDFAVGTCLYKDVLVATLTLQLLVGHVNDVRAYGVHEVL